MKAWNNAFWAAVAICGLVYCGYSLHQTGYGVGWVFGPQIGLLAVGAVLTLCRPGALASTLRVAGWWGAAILTGYGGAAVWLFLWLRTVCRRYPEGLSPQDWAFRCGAALAVVDAQLVVCWAIDNVPFHGGQWRPQEVPVDIWQVTAALVAAFVTLAIAHQRRKFWAVGATAALKVGVVVLLNCPIPWVEQGTPVFTWILVLSLAGDTIFAVALASDPSDRPEARDDAENLAAGNPSGTHESLVGGSSGPFR